VRPILQEFDFGRLHIAIASYATMLAIAALATIAISYVLCVRRGASAKRTAGFLLLTGVTVPVGARLLHFALTPAAYDGHLGRLVALSGSGFALFGGLLLAALVGPLAAHALDLDLWGMADACAPAIGIGIALTKVGCLMAGCCFGIVSNASRGIVFPPGSPAALWQFRMHLIGLRDPSLPVYPTQLYEMVAALFCAAAAAWFLSRKPAEGTVFLAFVATFTGFHWLIWTMRVPDAASTAPGWLYPALYVATVATCIVLAVARRRPQNEPVHRAERPDANQVALQAPEEQARLGGGGVPQGPAAGEQHGREPCRDEGGLA